MFALNENFLKCLTKEIRYRLFDLEDKDSLAFAYYVLLPNSTDTKKGRRPLSICLKQSSPKCLEQMLELLMLDQDQDYMRYIEPYLC